MSSSMMGKGDAGNPAGDRSDQVGPGSEGPEDGRLELGNLSSYKPSDIAATMRAQGLHGFVMTLVVECPTVDNRAAYGAAAETLAWELELLLSRGWKCSLISVEVFGSREEGLTAKPSD